LFGLGGSLMDAITYDLLFDILRYEKNKEDLQPLDKEFYIRIVEYLKSKDEILLNAHTSTTERELTRIQLNNIKKILRELYDRREKKIINLALYRIKTDSEMMNAENMLDEETALFESIYTVLSEYKSMIIDNVLLHIKPSIHAIKGIDVPSINGSQVVNSYTTESHNVTSNNSNDVSKNDSNEESDEDLDKVKSVRFVKPVPKFLGPNLETYGPFEEQDIASLPGLIAKILIRKERAEEIQMQ
jgi:DNA replication initiation complex subunit (GINS family)